MAELKFEVGTGVGTTVRIASSAHALVHVMLET